MRGESVPHAGHLAVVAWVTHQVIYVINLILVTLIFY
jgi:hypothetical protein